jgi:integrase
MSAKVKWRENRNAWYLVVYANGTQASKRYGPTTADKRRAARRAREVNEEQTRGKLGLKKREKPVPFDEFAERWIEEKGILPARRGMHGAVAPKTAKMREQMVRLHLTPFLKATDIRAIDSATVDALEAHFIRTGQPPSRRSIQIALGVLRLILADAVVKKIAQKNAVDEWKTAIQSSGRKPAGTASKKIAEWKVLDSEEREQLLAAFEQDASDHFPLVLWLAETGCRISEAETVTWGDLDLSRAEARVFRHKTGEEDYIELSERLVATLRSLAPDIRPSDLLVFRSPEGRPIHYQNFLNRVWNPVVLKVFGRDRRVTPHSLRHTWASLHLARGTPIEWVRRMGGWASAKMLLDVYAHYLPREMRGFSNSLSADDRTRPDQAAAGQPS